MVLIVAFHCNLILPQFSYLLVKTVHVVFLKVSLISRLSLFMLVHPKSVNKI